MKFYLDFPRDQPEMQIHCLRVQTLLAVKGIPAYVPGASSKVRRLSSRGSILIRVWREALKAPHTDIMEGVVATNVFKIQVHLLKPLFADRVWVNRVVRLLCVLIELSTYPKGDAIVSVLPCIEAGQKQPDLRTGKRPARRVSATSKRV